MCAWLLCAKYLVKKIKFECIQVMKSFELVGHGLFDQLCFSIYNAFIFVLINLWMSKVIRKILLYLIINVECYLKFKTEENIKSDQSYLR